MKWLQNLWRTIWVGSKQTEWHESSPTVFTPPVTLPPVTLPPVTSTRISYGYGFEARELINGKWVIWNKATDKAIDLGVYGHEWMPGEKYFKDCMCTREEIDTKALDVLAHYGVFKP